MLDTDDDDDDPPLVELGLPDPAGCLLSDFSTPISPTKEVWAGGEERLELFELPDFEGPPILEIGVIIWRIRPILLATSKENYTIWLLCSIIGLDAKKHVDVVLRD